MEIKVQLKENIKINNKEVYLITGKGAIDCDANIILIYVMAENNVILHKLFIPVNNIRCIEVLG